MNEEEFIAKFYSSDNEEQFLKDVHHNLECLQQENKELKEMHYLIQGGRGNGKTYLTKLLQQLDLYKSVIDEIKGIVEETNYLANKTEIVNRGNIELHGVIDRLCLILRKIEIIDKAKENVNETDNN